MAKKNKFIRLHLSDGNPKRTAAQCMIEIRRKSVVSITDLGRARVVHCVGTTVGYEVHDSTEEILALVEGRRAKMPVQE